RNNANSRYDDAVHRSPHAQSSRLHRWYVGFYRFVTPTHPWPGPNATSDSLDRKGSLVQSSVPVTATGRLNPALTNSPCFSYSINIRLIAPEPDSELEPILEIASLS